MPKDEFDPEDPQELVGVAAPGGERDEEYMALCIVDEFVRMGYGRPALLKMFQDPFYRMTHGVYLRRGEAYVAALVDRVLAQWTGGSRCRP